MPVATTVAIKIAQLRAASFERKIALAAAGLAAASLIYLRNFPYPHDLRLALQAIVALAPQTGWSALKVWLVWAWMALIIGAVSRRLDPRIEHFDAYLAGAAGTWVFAYLAGNLLGPLGLFRGPTLWIAIAAATLWLRHDLAQLVSCEFTPGMKLALIAAALAVFSLFPLQLSSPVVPYMDALSWPAAAQRIVTFGKYLPFDNDPYGCWGPNVQSPALELFYAMLALGAHCRLAVMA